MALTRTQLIIAAGVALALFVLIAALLIWWHRRRRVPRSKYGFTSGPLHDVTLPLYAPPSPGSLKLRKFVKARGDEVIDVLLEYVRIKGSTASVFSAQPTPESCVWWLGEKYPSHAKGISAAVMAGPRRNGEFRSKVVVLHDLPEAGALARALARAAKPKTGPTIFDAWNLPIAFSGFPLRAGDGIVITELTRIGAAANASSKPGS